MFCYRLLAYFLFVKVSDNGACTCPRIIWCMHLYTKLLCHLKKWVVSYLSARTIMRGNRVHSPTKKFFDTLSSHSFFPSILMPTRITYKSATLIDNIYIFQRKIKFSQSIISGNLYCDLSDHLPNFDILAYPEKMPPKTRPLIRVYNKKSTSTFSESLKKQNWDKVYEEKDPNKCFDNFYKTFKKIHDENFPLKKLSRKKSRDKPWMTKELHLMRKTRDENRKRVNEGKLDSRTYKAQKNLRRK